MQAITRNTPANWRISTGSDGRTDRVQLSGTTHAPLVKRSIDRLISRQQLSLGITPVGLN